METNAHLTVEEIADELSADDRFTVHEIRDDDVVVSTTEDWTPKQAGSRISGASTTVLTTYATNQSGVYIVEDSDYEPVTEIKDASEVF